MSHLSGSGVRRRLHGCNIGSTLVGRFLSTLGGYRFTHFTPNSSGRTVSGMCSTSLRIVDGVRGSVGRWSKKGNGRWGVIFCS